MARKAKTPKWLQAAREAGKAGVVKEKPDWLARALSRAGVMPLADAEAAIGAGRVRVGGKTVREPFAPVRDGERVHVDGGEVSLQAPLWVLAFHKPAGIVTSAVDPQGQGTVFDALHTALSPDLRRYGWHAVGRLDRDTTGLLLFTNDERLVAHVTSPSTHLPKRYIARVSGKADDAKLEPLRQGLVLDDGAARPARAILRAPDVVELTLTEGRHHQVKRMLGKVGLPVLALHREAIGGVELDIPLGSYRPLRAEEIREGLRFVA
ncbi:MAG: pseudouridine synthase [Myxococcota bacterium]